MKNKYLLILLFFFPGNLLFGQHESSVSIKVAATVVEKVDIELVTMKDMDIDIGMAKDGKIIISAQRDAMAAKIMVKGKSTASFRVTFIPIAEVTNSNGSGSLELRYELYGYNTDNQSASEPIDAAARALQFNEEGKYYLWIGGYIDISKAQPGSYDGEFTLQIEYI
jgi:hypothetical protein